MRILRNGLIVIIIVILIFVSCNSVMQNNDEKRIEEENRLINKEHTGDFNLEKYEKSIYQFIISNQSFDVPLINLKCYLDDQLIISDKYEVLNQHEYSYYFFDLEPGDYNLLIESENGEKLRKTISITDEQLYAYITYWSDGEKGKIDYFESDSPIGLD